MYIERRTHIDHGQVPQRLFRRLSNLVSSLDADDWEQNSYRQNTFDVHRKTFAYIYRFTDDQGKTVLFDILSDGSTAKGIDVMCDVFDFAEARLGLRDIRVDRCMLAKLPAGEDIRAHIDAAPIYDFSRRLHIPITTNDKCQFFVGSEIVPMKVGRLIEINNRLMHWVVNAGKTDRVHLIFDVSEK